MTSISRNMYSDELDDMVNECNDTYHRTTKTKPVDVKSSAYIDFGVINNEKNPKFEVGDHVRILKYNSIFAKDYVPNWSEEVFVTKKVKTMHWTYLIEDINEAKHFGKFYEKELQKINQTDFRIEKIIRRKGDRLSIKWKGYDNSLTVGLIKKIFLYKMSYFQTPCPRSKDKIKVEIDFSNYAAQSDLKNGTDVDTSKFAKMNNLANLKSNIDKLDIGKFETALIDLTKLSDAV